MPVFEVVISLEKIYHTEKKMY